MKFTLEIELGNDAMQTGDDVAGELRAVADRIGGAELTPEFGVFRVRDVNGNTVGQYGVTDVG